MPKILNTFEPEVSDDEISRLSKKKDVGMIGAVARDCLFYKSIFRLVQNMIVTDSDSGKYAGPDRRQGDRRVISN